jgi:hypothetical protein
MAEHVVYGIATTTTYADDLDEVASANVYCGFKY